MIKDPPRYAVKSMVLGSFIALGIGSWVWFVSNFDKSKDKTRE